MDEEGNEDAPPVCGRYKKMLETFNFEGVAEHMSLACTECAELALNFYSQGRQLLFKDRLPSWLQRAKDEEEERLAAEQAAAEARARFEQRASKALPKKEGPKNPEEIQQYIQEMNMNPKVTDASLVWEIRKLKKISEEEARAEVIKMRQLRNEIRKTERTADEPPAKKQRREEKIPFTEKGTPWLPNLHEYYPQKERSALSDADQTRLINICSTLIFSGVSRFTGNKEELKAYDKSIEEERVKLDEMIVNELNPLTNYKFPVPAWMNTYCKNRARRRWISVYGMRFYNESIESIHWDGTIPTEMSAELKKAVQLEEVLANGRMDRIRIPSLEKQLMLNTNTIEMEKKYNIACSNRFPIEEDKMALDYCLDKNISIAMDASTACYMMTREFLSKPGRPRYTVTVKQIIHEGTIRKVAFISKPKIAGPQHNTVFLKNFAKYAFKTMYVEKRREDQPFQPKLLKEIDNETSIPLAAESALHIAEDVEMSHGPSKQASDPLDNIMSSITLENTAATAGKNPTGKRYSVFRIGSQNVLIRSSAPMECHSSKLQNLNEKPITLDTVIEMVPNAGACRLDPEEVLYSYCKKLFKVAEGHAFVRIGVETPRPQGRNWRTQETKTLGQLQLNVLQIHRLCFLNDQKSAEIEKEIMNMFSYRAHCFEELLTHLVTLEQGYFLLWENGKKMHISKEKLDYTGMCINFEKQQLIKHDKHFPPFPNVFFGIDHRIFLQWQIYIHRAPGAFIAPDCPVAIALNRVDHKKDLKNTDQYQQMRKRKNRAKKIHAKIGKTTEKDDDEIDETANEPVVEAGNKEIVEKVNENVAEKDKEEVVNKDKEEVVAKDNKNVEKDNEASEGEDYSEMSYISEIEGQGNDNVLLLDTGDLEIDIPDEEE